MNNRLWFIVLRRLNRTKVSRIHLAYDSELVEDGLGAQIQRQMSIRALSHHLNVSFIPQPIRHIAIHPFDDFKTTEEMKLRLVDINKLFMFSENSFPKDAEVIRIGNLRLGKLTGITLRSLINRKKYVLKIAEAYSLVDSEVEMYRQIQKINVGALRSFVEERGIERSDICIHIRQGVGGKVIYPGQKVPRELDAGHFLSVLRSIEFKNKRIIVLTDAPEEDVLFFPQKDQIHLWENTPGFNNGVVTIKGQKLNHFFNTNGINVEVISGGDLLSSLLIMITCNTLIISRSSLSYVGALVNDRARIYYPPGFWHPPLRGWEIT